MRSEGAGHRTALIISTMSRPNNPSIGLTIGSGTIRRLLQLTKASFLTVCAAGGTPNQSQPVLVKALPETERIDIETKNQHIHRFGDGGAHAALSKFGELLQFSTPIIDRDGICNYVSVENRAVVALDSKYKRRTHEDTDWSKAEEEDEYDVNSKADLFTSETSFSNFSRWARARMGALGSLYKEPSTGWGLRLSAQSGVVKLCGMRYREDRWPEFDLEIEGKADVKIKVQYVVNQQRLVQQYTITSISSEVKELFLEVDLAAATRRLFFGKPLELDADEPFRNEHSLWKLHDGSHVSVEGCTQKLLVAIFKDGIGFPLDGIQDAESLSVLSTDPICHQQSIQLPPGETVVFTAMYKILDINAKEDKQDIENSLLAAFAENHSRWWKFKQKSQGSAFIYRRTLENIIGVEAVPLPASEPGGIRPYILGDASISSMQHYSLDAMYVYVSSVV